MTTIKGTIAIMQTMHAALTGVATAPTTFIEYPRNEIPRSELPCVLVYPEDGIWNFPTMGCVGMTRSYTIRVLVADTNTGLRGEHLETITDLMEVFGAEYLDSTNTLQSTADLSIDYSAPITDSGYLELMFYVDKPYHGFEFIVSVKRTC